MRSRRASAFGWDDGLYALHPEAHEVDGVPAVADLEEIDDPVDYLLVAVPAARCADVVRATAGRVPFVHVISGGFDEIGTDGAALSEGLLAAARAANTRVIGPNCIGVYSPAGRQAFLLNAPHASGTVSVVSQSGGLSGDVITTGARRGVRFSKVLSIGNAIDVTPGEVLDWLVDDPDTAVIGLYLEGAISAGRLVDALRRARGEKPVVLLVGGESTQGAVAVASHTGALAGEQRVWEAIARSTGAALVHTLEQFVATLAYLQRWWGVGAGGSDVLVVGVGGGASVLATDACDRAGLRLEPTTPAVRSMLRAMGLGAGTSVANPLEIPFGPAAPVDALRAVLTPLLRDQPYPDVLVHVNVSAYYGYGTEGVTPLVAQLADLAAAPLGDARLGVVLRNLDVAPGADADALRTRGGGSRPGDVSDPRRRRGRDRGEGAIGLVCSMSEHPFRDRAAIVGVGATPYSKNSGVSTLTLALRRDRRRGGRRRSLVARHRRSGVPSSGRLRAGDDRERVARTPRRPLPPRPVRRREHLARDRRCRGDGGGHRAGRLRRVLAGRERAL